MEILKDHRAEIDRLDDEIIDLLIRRFEIVAQVAKIKSKNNIPASLPDRIEEVKARNVSRAQDKGLDGGFVRRLYGEIIDHAISFEDAYMDAQKADASS